jgi:hypothetical protein
LPRHESERPRGGREDQQRHAERKHERLTYPATDGQDLAADEKQQDRDVHQSGHPHERTIRP